MYQQVGPPINILIPKLRPPSSKSNIENNTFYSSLEENNVNILSNKKCLISTKPINQIQSKKKT